MNSSIKWQYFVVGDLFDVKRGNAKDVSTRANNGSIALVSAMDSNNAVLGTTSNLLNETISKDTITIHNNGNGVGLAFVHFYPFIATSDVSILTSKVGPISQYALLFLIPILQKQRIKYSYGYKLSNNRLRRQKISLPIDEKGKPNFIFMDTYMRDIEHKLIARYHNTLTERDRDRELSTIRRYEAFYISKNRDGLFALNATSNGIDKNKIQSGPVKNFPYITRTDYNNGWDMLISKQNDLSYNEGNVISLGLDTQTAFYQPIPFYTGQNIQVLSGKVFNRFTALFVIPLLKKQMKSKFNWGGYGATLGRLNKMKIMLPVKSDGSPDYEYMEAVMRNIEHRLIISYLDNK